VAEYTFSVKNDIRSNSREVVITRISFEHLAPTRQKVVKLYSRKEEDPWQWVETASVKAPRRDFIFTEFVLETPITLAKGEAVGFYIKTQENILLVGKDSQRTRETYPADVQLSYGSALSNGLFGAVSEGFVWNGEVTYYLSS